MNDAFTLPFRRENMNTREELSVVGLASVIWLAG